MLDKIIEFSIKNKFIVGLFTLALVLVGIYNLSRLPIDALPDITNNQVQVITTAPTLATQEVEQFITYPIEQTMKTIPKIVEMRSISRFGLSVITLVFEENVDIYWARQQMSEKLKDAERLIPKGTGIPELAPISTGLGEIYQYVIFAKKGFEDKYDASKLRSIQDWVVKPQLLGTAGIAEVTTLGGDLKQYEIAVQPDRLKSMNVTITDIFIALEKNNENTGGAYIDKQPYVYFIRALGMVKNIADIEKIVVKNNNGIPILIRDVAKVQEGSALRYGAVTKDGKGEVVGGMVLMLKGENSSAVVNRTKAKVEQIRKSLPEGVALEPFIDRTKLVNNAIGTVEKNLLEGALIVIFVLVLLLGNWRAGLIVASVIPLALLFAVTMMNLFGVSGNLMSLGAIDFGLIVDGAVIIVEAVIHRLQQNKEGRLDNQQMDDEVLHAATKIRSSAAFGEIIILIVYLPILALVGTEGKMFKPMAQTVSFAILGAFILSLTYVPMASALFLSKTISHKKNVSDKIIDFIYRFYQPILDGALRLKAVVLSVAVVFFGVVLLIFSRMGGEFIPTLEEGDYAINFRIANGSSLSMSIETSIQLEKRLRNKFPEVVEVVSKIGSAEIPTDPMPIETGDLIIILKDKSEWTTTKDFYQLADMMKEELEQIPGVGFEVSQPIQMRFNELMTGVRSDIAIKIFGEDLEKLAVTANSTIGLIGNIEGVADIKAEQVTGMPQITVRYNPDKMALYGLNVGDLNKVVRTGFAGEATGKVYEGERRYDLVVRLDKDFRQDISNVKNIFISLPSGNQIPLEQVADVNFEQGPAQISREDGRRRIVIGLNVRGRDVKSVVNDIQARLDAKLKLPEGYYITYGGQFENLVEANKRLAVAVPAALLLIFVLLYFTFHSVKQSLLIFTAIPLSAIGGVFALWLRGMPFSISAGIGFIALFGVAVLNGIVLIGYFNQLKAEGWDDILARIKEGTKVRLRPVVMTAAVASLGFLPMALSSGAGAEVQKPLATVVIGGLITATLLTLIVLPILYFLLEKGIKPPKKASIVASLLLFLFWSNATNAQEKQTLNLNQAIELGTKNNTLVQANELAIKTQSQLKPTAIELPKTSINAMFGQYNTRSFDQSYTIAQSFSPFQFQAKKQLINENIKNSELKLASTKHDIIYQIRQSWNMILYWSAVNQLLQKQEEYLKVFVDAAKLRFKTGESNLLEKTTAETKQQELAQIRKQNDGLIVREKIKLKNILNLKEDFVLAENNFSPSKALYADSLYINQNPMLQVAMQQVEIANAFKNVEKAQRKPDFSAGYFLQSLTGNQDIEGKTTYYNGSPRFQGVNLGISIPLFGKASNARIKASGTEVLVQQKNVEYLKNQLNSQLLQQIEEQKVNQSLIDYYIQTALPNAEIISSNAQKAFQNGEIGYVEYLQGLETVLSIQQNNLSVISQFNQNNINIQYLLNN
ncbi:MULTISPECIES: CusA/CzcA family heavy metal efflux RND transporter [unclassified Arcicella]|uniref:CusA/CzcA family heavy metal efflux RND transporter n=1 Tax=unclassified Arcicella TaxID=2644986 RepID=UPI00285D79D4|nr:MULTISPECIES: CusA/CzcA family heavy metal efflux RND transporter [unclassified Arcicella]MDR6563817.1 cobalt-zinc-cadmium resistance protein CzcA [Arcicella sp. BE51]MDR6813499.1 cobalt-zinc-cadmium resistance protein CzcA [Arcicella sp. BE140]MDR6824812.1 cobalt-zinc-cadmium resistance protein CzcA [Arcicella sp. BE139]